MGEHGEGDMSVPGVPGADLVVVESDFVLAGSEAFFDGPACSGHADELSGSCVVWVVAVVEREFTVGDGSADQVLVVGVIGVDERPVVDAPTPSIRYRRIGVATSWRATAARVRRTALSLLWRR